MEGVEKSYVLTWEKVQKRSFCVGLFLGCLRS